MKCHTKTIPILISAVLVFGFNNKTIADDTTYIKVHFLYGSKPGKEFKEIESEWFGGKHGGHVGIELDSNKVLDFVPQGKFHWFAKKNNRHSKFEIHTSTGFWGIFGGSVEPVKKATIVVPLCKQQKQKLDSIFIAYTTFVPYDYAFMGMRCAGAAYDILAQIGVLKPLSYNMTYLKIFYPKKLRKRLLNKAAVNNWTIIRQTGSLKRQWEAD